MNPVPPSIPTRCGWDRSGGVLAGLLLGWWYSSLLWIIVSPAVGVVVGYALRRSELFVLRLRRCPRHADARTLPGLSLFHGELILRVGHRDVKLAFLHREHAFRDPDESAPRPWSEPPQRPQLAESVAESAAIIPEGEAHRFAAAEDGESASTSASTPLGLAPAHVIPGPAAADSGAGLETDDGYRVQTPSISRPA
ncbi:MAG: hypothetical protein ACKV0T_24230 [Planctomycetales bacterium]